MKFDDPGYLQGYADALKRFSQELDSYKDFAFASDAFTDAEVEGITRMEADLQQWLNDHVGEIEEELE